MYPKEFRRLLVSFFIFLIMVSYMYPVYKNVSELAFYDFSQQVTFMLSGYTHVTKMEKIEKFKLVKIEISGKISYSVLK